MRLRPAMESDAEAVRATVAAAFGRTDEADLVDRLRADGDAVVSLVAEDEGKVVGHLTLSRMTAPFRALALAPVSVTPGRQGRGIGSAMILAAVEAARLGGWQGVFVLGDQAYYSRFGFDVAAAKGFDSPFAGDHFALLALTERSAMAEGEVIHAPGFFA